MSVTFTKRPDGSITGWERDDTRVVEARTIRDLRDLRQYYEACLAALAGADEGAIRFAKPLDLRLSETKMADGTLVHDLYVRPW
jgi:hypothetical protein